MMADHLYDRFGKPDFVLSEHDDPSIAAGDVSIKGGPLLASANTITLTMRGIGGHGSAPQAGKDPILLAAEFVLVSQSIVSRQIDPQQPAVLSVGMIHGGTKNNIIPDEVTLGLTLRTYSPAVRDQIIADVPRTANGLAGAYGIPADRMPIVTLGESAPATFNDVVLAERLRTLQSTATGRQPRGDVGPGNGYGGCGPVFPRRQNSRRDVLARRGRPGQVSREPEDRRAAAQPALRTLYPIYAPAITTGVTAMTSMAIRLVEIATFTCCFEFTSPGQPGPRKPPRGCDRAARDCPTRPCAGSCSQKQRRSSDRPRTTCPPHRPKRTCPCRRADLLPVDQRPPHN